MLYPFKRRCDRPVAALVAPEWIWRHTPAMWKYLLILPFALLLYLARLAPALAAGPTPPTPATVPQEYRALYAELASRLDRFESRLGNPEPRKILLATNLLTANSHAGPALLRPDWQRYNLLYLDRLQALGLNAVSVTISYPLLTPTFDDPAPYLRFYETLATEVRRRGMKLLVEHNVLLPGYTLVPVRPYYAQVDFKRFTHERYAEVLHIVQHVRPDYLSLVLEPQTHGIALGKRLGINDWARYVRNIVANLSKDVPQRNTLLGAGCGSWEDPAYISRFARIKGLDYIDLHLYPLSNDYTDYLQRALDWADEVKRLDARKRLVISEAWLFKAAAGELGGDPADARMFARDVYSFWEPLDAQYMRMLGKLARAKGFELISPFWSRYFFSYLSYGNPAQQALAPHALMKQANQAAFAALLTNRTTETGRAYGSINR